MNRKIAWYASLLLIVGCAKETNEHAIENPSSEIIPVEEALSHLRDFLDLVSPNVKSSALQVSDVVAFGGCNVKSKAIDGFDIPDTLMYICRVEDGYAVLPANRCQTANVYAYAANATVSESDFANAYERIIFSPAEEDSGDCEDFVDMGEEFVHWLVLSDVLLDYYQVKGTECEGIDSSTKSMSTVYGPYVKTTRGQEKPLNNICNPNGPVGCAATACGQIVVANKKSNSMIFNGKLCDWNSLESIYHYSNIGYDGGSEARSQGANFMKIIGDHDHCRIDYGTESSSGNAEGVQRAFQALGYKDVDKHVGFGSKNQGIAKRVIKNGKPIYLRGQGGGEGHGWVLDGYAVDSSGKDYYHVNWGWRGRSDGYFRCGAFDSSKVFEKDSTIDANCSGIESGNYVRYYRMVTYSL